MFVASPILVSTYTHLHEYKAGTNDRSDTLLRHSRIHKQGSDDIRTTKGATSNEAAESRLQEDSPSRNPGGPRAVGTTGTASTDHLTPASYPTRTLLAHEQQGSRPIALNANIQTLSNDSAAYPMTALNTLQNGTYSGTSLDQFQTAPSMLPSPPYADTGSDVVARDNQYGNHDPLETLVFEESLGYSSTHWLLEDDFDFTVFENLGFSSTLHEPHLAHNNEASYQSPHTSSQRPGPRLTVPDLRYIWYIQIHDDEPQAGSGTVTPANKTQGPFDDIDETYRDKLAATLRPPIRDDLLPSIEFLNLCIHLFFTRFNVALPLIHSPTFRSQHSNALLVLSICSAGCLSMASESAARMGSMLFERVNKTILVAPWERNLPRSTDHTWNTIKAAMIGQTYALTSGDPAHRATAAAFHGSMIALARHHKLLSQTPHFKLDEDLNPGQLDKAWRIWARQEELKRVAVLLYIHDAELAALFHHEPIFRHNAGFIPAVCSDELFSAPSAPIWASLFRAEQRGTHLDGIDSRSELDAVSGGERFGIQIPAPRQGLGNQTMFNVYNKLSGIGASVAECRHLDLLSFMMVNKFESDLLTWYASTPTTFKVSENHLRQAATPFSLLPLWHHTFITLCTNLNILELAAGREGSEIAVSTRQYVLSWIASPDSKRCLLHALFLQNLVVSTNIGALVAMHTPRILFSAALCWYCYLMYVPESSSAPSSSTTSLMEGIHEHLNSLPELQLLREGTGQASANFYPVPQILEDSITGLPKILAANSAEIKANTLCVIESILRRLGSCGISLRFADIIQVFISGAMDKTSHDEKVDRLGRLS